MTFLSDDLIWWITVIDLPVTAALFAMIWRTRCESNTTIDQLHNTLERRNEQLRDALNGFKLEVAKTYASQSDLRELEGRLVGHLLRIESKLDTTALKAEALRAKAKPE